MTDDQGVEPKPSAVPRSTFDRKPTLVLPVTTFLACLALRSPGLLLHPRFLGRRGKPVLRSASDHEPPEGALQSPERKLSVPHECLRRDRPPVTREVGGHCHDLSRPRGGDGLLLADGQAPSIPGMLGLDGLLGLRAVCAPARRLRSLPQRDERPMGVVRDRPPALPVRRSPRGEPGGAPALWGAAGLRHDGHADLYPPGRCSWSVRFGAARHSDG